MTIKVNYSGTLDEFELEMYESRKKGYPPPKAYSRELNEYKSVFAWMNTSGDVTVIGADFTRTFHLLGKGRSKSGKFRMEFCND